MARAVALPGNRNRTARTSPSRVLLVLLALACLTLNLVAVSVRAPPPIPMTTQGDAFDAAGSPLLAGTVIRTLLDGVDYSNDTAVSNAQGAFSVATAGNLAINATTPEPSPMKVGANLGEPILYAAGSFATQVEVFQEVTTWHPDLTVTQDLHLASAAASPEPMRIQGLVTQPARGGAQYVFLCNPTATILSLANYYLQVDRPGTYYGGNLTLTGSLGADGQTRVNLTSAFSLIPTGDALKLVYRNPGGAGAPAEGRDFVIDRLEYNATENGTLDWQPGNTILGDAPAPGPGQVLERATFCSAAAAPGAYVLGKEPGLPPSAAPTVTITAPSAGQNVQGGAAYTIRWTMTDPVFVSNYLRVWVNVTVQGTTTNVLDGALGATSATWNVPDVSASNAVVRVSVLNPFGSQGNVSTTFNVVPSTPYSVYIAILVIVVIAVFVVVAYVYARRRQEPPPAPPSSGPPASPPSAVPPTLGGPPPTVAAGTKTCPTCGTQVRAADETCFFCGSPFPKPPT